MPGSSGRTSSPAHLIAWLAVQALLMTAAAGPDPAAAAPPGGLAGMTGGIKAGPAFAQHQGIDDPRLPYTVDSSWRRGVSAAAFLHFPVTDRFGLQQEVVYVRKGSRQIIGVEIFPDVAPVDLDVVYDLDYLEVPVLLRFVWLRGRRLDLYSLSGFSFALKLKDRYRLSGLVVGEPDEDPIPLSADAPMDEVDIFDFGFVYGMGLELPVMGRRALLEYRFSLSLEQLALPTYAYVPTWDGSRLRVDNEPVPLRNQAHALMMGIRF